jgi:phosphopantothenate-cysteine ligase
VRNIIITAGGTSEKIDEVRVISNFSSGRLGLAVAKSFLESDSADVGKIYYLCDKNTNAPDHEWSKSFGCSECRDCWKHWKIC